MNASELLERTPCPACGGEFSDLCAYPGGSASKGQAPRFESIAICGHCGLGKALPWHDQATLDAFYASGDYWSGAVGATAVQSAHEKWQAWNRTGWVRNRIGIPNTLRVLDIGAGHGWVLRWLPAVFPGTRLEYAFIEPDDQLARQIPDHVPQVPCTRITDLGAVCRSFDLVFLNHVLEHVADPGAMLTMLHGLLANNGTAYIETPHADQRYKSDVFPHTWFFTPRAFTELGRDSGFTELENTAFGRWPGASKINARRLIAIGWSKLFALAVHMGFEPAEQVFDKALWKYEQGGPGAIWIRWILRREGA